MFMLQSTHMLKALTLSIGAALLTTTAYAAPIQVINGKDSGEGSMRAALEAVASGKANNIIVMTKEEIEINSTLVYNGQAPISIYGSGQTIETDKNINLLSITEGADVNISGLKFEGPGGFSIENRGDLDGEAGKGIFVNVRNDQTGTLTVTLNDVEVSGVAGHGIHVSDCDIAENCGAGAGGEGGGSPASIAVNAYNVHVHDIGYGRVDGDGLRVDERNAGDIHFTAHQSRFVKVGADGVELDEGQDGSVIVNVSNVDFSNNGGYCQKDLLENLLPSPTEAEFKQGVMMASNVPVAITGSPDDKCFEREVELYKDGSVEAYEFGIDFDDGFDIDEAGNGGIQAVIYASTIRNNLDEGLDFDEEGDGSIDITIVGTDASGNTDDGFKVTEENNGNLNALISSVNSKKNHGKGITLESKDDGMVTALIENSETEGNDTGKKSGLKVKGQGVITLKGSEIKDGFKAKNAEIVQR
ncbi:hypothetical protein [Marinomonas flavescens]|uniref:hypothetical protein n=1 Tax=Marinomonas flavescens TaxID=2529379 RepID=UPI001055406E|nr:hypothetical protein [Marinomonas flavescens]